MSQTVTAETVVQAAQREECARVLVVEDDAALQEAIVDTLELAGFQLTAASSAEQALSLLQSQCFDMVISDVNMGGMDGHQLLRQIKKEQPLLPVLLITAYASIERSVDAMRSGAVDYLVKPFEPQVLIELVERHTIGLSLQVGEPIAVSAASRELFQLARRVAASDSTVLLSGESGTGKEVLARYIHQYSQRRNAAFVAINCAAIPESMLEATLFGHEKGAFTGAYQSAPGKFEQANGGTLLLDEVSEMDLSLQAKLLRVLQEREVERVGGRAALALDVRVIATSNRDLAAEVAAGRFREDLFYRLSVFPMHWPALRQRAEDIIPLAQCFLLQNAAKMGRSPAQLSAAAAQQLSRHRWPGNVRELDNIIQRALILQPGDNIEVGDLLFDTVGRPAAGDLSPAVPAAASNQEPATIEAVLGEDLKQREYEIIVEALRETQGSKKDAALKLGVSPRTLRYKLARMRQQGIAV